MAPGLPFATERRLHGVAGLRDRGQQQLPRPRALDLLAALHHRRPDLKSVAATLELKHLGIIAIGAEQADGWVTKKGAKSASGRIVAELYVESVVLKPGS